VAVVRAVENHKHKKIWKDLVVRGLKQANSWLIPAEKYIDLYYTTIKLKKKNGRAMKN
jgi:glycogen synthase